MSALEWISRPVVRYLKWLGRVATGDFGESTSLRSPVGPLIVKHAINSGILAGTALLLIMPIAFLLGIFAGLYPNKFAGPGNLADQPDSNFDS